MSSSNPLAVGALLVGAVAAPIQTTTTTTTATATANVSFLDPPAPAAARKDRVICNCASRCGTPGKYVHPSTRSVHRRRERQAAMDAEAKDVVNENARPGGAPPPPQTMAAQVPTTTTTAAAAPLKFLSIPAVPNPNSPTSGLFKQLKLSTPSAVGTLGAARQDDGAGTSSLPTRSLTELHMRNPAQIMSAGTRRTTFASFIPPALPAVQQTLQVPVPPQPQPLFPLNTNTNKHISNNNSFAVSNPNPSFAADSPTAGPLSSSSKERIEAWVRDTSRYTGPGGDLIRFQALDAELAITRNSLYDAQRQNEELAKRSMNEKETLELELQRMEDDNKKLRAQVSLRNHVWNSVQSFVKMYGQESLPPFLRLPSNVPVQNAVVYYESFISQFVQDQLHLTELAMAKQAAAMQKAASKRSSIDYSIKYETSSSLSPSDDMSVDPSPTTTTAAGSRVNHGGYQSLRCQPEKRRRYNPLS